MYATNKLLKVIVPASLASRFSLHRVKYLVLNRFCRGKQEILPIQSTNDN